MTLTRPAYMKYAVLIGNSIRRLSFDVALPNLYVCCQVFHIPQDERKYDSTNRFGEGDLLKTCSDIMQATGANIEASYAKDQSLTFVVIGMNLYMRFV